MLKNKSILYCSSILKLWIVKHINSTPFTKWTERAGVMLQSIYPTNNSSTHGLRTPREKIAFTKRPKIHSHFQFFRYGQSIFCMSHWPNFSDIFDVCLHCVFVVRGSTLQAMTCQFYIKLTNSFCYCKLHNCTYLF